MIGPGPGGGIGFTERLLLEKATALLRKGLALDSDSDGALTEEVGAAEDTPGLRLGLMDMPALDDRLVIGADGLAEADTRADGDRDDGPELRALALGLSDDDATTELMNGEALGDSEALLLSDADRDGLSELNTPDRLGEESVLVLGEERGVELMPGLDLLD